MPRKIDENWLKDAITVDRFNLIHEWERQPKLIMDLGESAVQAEAERDRLKDRIDIERAELDSEIRQDPKKFGIDKITEGAIKSAIETDKKIQEMTEEYRESIKNMKILNVGMQALDHKKKALEKMSDLWIASYWGNPRIEGQAKDLGERQRKEGQSRALEESHHGKRK